MDVIYKMLLEFDEDKVLREGKYDLDKMKAFVNEICENRGVQRDEKGMYVSRNWVSIASVTSILRHTDWCIENALRWIRYRSDDGGINWYSEDVIEEIALFDNKYN
ncbi:MAG: hypothetical protein IJ079_03575 [Lachnospiraceae bacterium]|nr:hypothetical protein [Lachnospiraceae bacterium]